MNLETIEALVFIIAAFQLTQREVYGPRQNLLRNVVKTFSLNKCFRHSYSKMCKNVTLSGHNNYSDVSMSHFERLTPFMYECAKLYKQKMTTFDDATAQRTVINFCVQGGMTLIQILKQMQSQIDISMYLSILFTSSMADLVMCGHTVLLVDDCHARIKSKFWLSRTSLKAFVGRQCTK